MNTPTLILVIIIVGFTLWLKRKDWFSKKDQLITKKSTKSSVESEPKVSEEVDSHNASPLTSKKTKWGRIIAGGVALLVVFFAGILIEKSSKNSSSDTPSSGSFREDKTEGVESSALKLMFDDYTPCSPSIDYKFELDTQGDSISIKFPGVNEVIHYSGKGAIKVPPREDGSVQISSLNPAREARVRIWKVIKVKEG